MNDLFNPENGGIANLYGWMGQIVDESNWFQNHANKEFKHKLHTRDDVAGFGYRYKVRIFGRDTRAKDVPDDQLEMAEVILPVTAGSGHAGSVQTPNLRQGMYVWGFYKDGMDGTEPIIVGVLPNHSQTRLFGGDPDKAYDPRSGFYGKERILPIATKNINIEGPSSVACAENPQNCATICHWDQNKDGNRAFLVPKTFKCDGPNGEVKGIQKTIKFLLALIKRIKKEAGSFLDAVSDLPNDIESILDEFTDLITSLVKSLFRKIRGFVVNKLNGIVSKLIDLVPPNLRPGAVEAQKNATDTIQCVFNKIISRLLQLVKDLLKDVIDKYVNAPLCAVESFVGNILSSTLGELTSGINDALSFIDSVLGPVGDIADFIFDALDFITGILNFLSCDEELDCSMKDEWSFWKGLRLDLEDLSGDFGEKLKEFTNSNKETPCNTSQIPCAPPIPLFADGGGSGLAGNLVIGVAGNILGMDISNPGSGYKTPPKISVYDGCGLGDGAVLEPIMIPEVRNTSQTTTFKVDKVAVIDPGVGYLNSVSEMTGGDEYKLSDKCDSIIGNTAYSPGKVISVKQGQTIYLPIGTTVEVFDSSGRVVQTLNGRGQINGIPLTASGTLTTPECVSSTATTPPPPNQIIISPPSGISTSGNYSVVASIDDVVILNPGANYSPNDKITITPDNGAELKPEFDESGSLTNVIIVSPGQGFTDFPQITIQSETGFNAVIRPVFKFTRVNSVEELMQIAPGAQVINVVDCVGKF